MLPKGLKKNAKSILLEWKKNTFLQSVNRLTEFFFHVLKLCYVLSGMLEMSIQENVPQTLTFLCLQSFCENLWSTKRFKKRFTWNLFKRIISKNPSKNETSSSCRRDVSWGCGSLYGRRGKKLFLNLIKSKL